MEKKVINFCLTFSIVSVLVLSIALVVYVGFHDYFFVRVYDLSQDLVAAGIISSEWSSDLMIVTLQQIPEFLDIMWLFAFLATVAGLVIGSYFSRRMGYGEVFTWLTFGMFVVLFLSSIFNQITNWLKVVLIDGLLVNLAANLTWFEFYLSNYGITNAIVMILCILANFVDFDLLKNFNRKERESEILGDEI